MQTTPRPSMISDSNRSINIESNGSNLRVYQVWKGSNKFCLGGRLIFGPDVRSIFLTVFLIMTPVILFCSCISQRLISEFHYPLGRLIIATCIVLAVFVIFLLLLTSGRDPGIIPRNLHPPEPEDDSSNLSADWAGSQHSQPSLPPMKDVVINGMVVKVKYCQTCMLYRPPRCSHCSICNNCVDRFDHHCPWVGQCIGKRNYRYFFMFVSSTTMLCLYVHAICWVNIKEIMNAYHYNLWKAFGKSPVSGVLILYTFITAWFVGGLTTFHLYLILTNQTTYENFRYRYNAKMNPYNKGCVGNIMDVFFSKIPSSRNNFREKVKGESFSVSAPSTSLRQQVTSLEMPKRSFDVEIGKRRAVADEDIEEIQSQIDSIGGMERSGTQPPHNHKGEWEVSPDICTMASEFRTEHGLGERQKINGVL